MTVGRQTRQVERAGTGDAGTETDEVQCPCPSCGWQHVCQTRRLACERYAHYVNGEAGGERRPRRALYARVFALEDAGGLA